MLKARKNGFLLCETAGAALWLVLALCVCPAAGLGTAVMLACIWVCVLLAARILHLDSKAERWALLGAMIFLGVLLILNTDFFLSHAGAKQDAPYLANHDSARYWGIINAILASHAVPSDTFVNYTYITAPLAKLFGLRGVLGLNALCTMLTLCFSGRIARECSPHKPSDTSAATIVMLTLAFNFMAHGTVLLKDAVMIAGFSGAVAALLILRNSGHRNHPWALAGALIACIATITVRTLSVPMLIIFILALMPWKEVSEGKQKRTALIFGAIALVCIATAIILNLCMDNTAVTIARNTVRVSDETIFSNSQRGSSLSSFISAYPGMHVWQRVAALPLTMALQLFIPLPWTYLRHIDYGPSMMLAHVGYPLYIEAGLVMYFFIFALRKAPRRLALTSGAGLLFFIMMAYAYGGTVSRYALMLLPLLIPAGAWVLVNFRRERALKLWMLAYTLLLAVALGIGMYMYNLIPSGNDLLC